MLAPVNRRREVKYIIPYVLFTIGGVIEEGEAVPLVATSEHYALRFFWLSYCQYVDLVMNTLTFRPFALYWREFPNFVMDQGHFVLWARLLVSGKPPLP